MRPLLFISLIACCSLMGCEKDPFLITEVPFPGCNFVQQFEEDQFQSFASDNFSIISLEVGDDCLIISFRAPRCEDNEWSLAMVASTNVDNTSPPQRSIRFLLENSRGCQEVEQGVAQYDLTSLRVVSDSLLVLNILGTNQTIEYGY